MQNNLKEKYFITDEELSRAVSQIKLGNLCCNVAVLCAIADLLVNGDIQGAATQNKIEFAGRDHEAFYNEQITKVKHNDCYHRALIYALGITEDTRKHFNQIFNVEKDCVYFDSLHDGFVTGTDARIMRLAFNLFTDSAPDDETEKYTVSQIFGYDSTSKYMLQAIEIRFELRGAL